MKKKEGASPTAAELRHQAEQRLQERRTKPATPQTEPDTLRLLHELQVHEIELEMQNAELRRSREEVEAGLERYLDLYDGAPLGYFTLARNGAIVQVNLTGARLLGLERGALLKRRFGHFVAADDGPAFGAYLHRVFQGRGQEGCEVAICREGPPSASAPGGAGPGSRYVRIEAVATADRQACRAMVLDITRHRQTEESLLKSRALNQAVVDALVSNICVLDADGQIISTNQAWDQFAGENGSPPSAGNYLGADYFAVCRAAIAAGDEIAGQALAGLEAVVRGDRARFELEYPCHSPTVERWFMMSASALNEPRGSIVVAHLNITERRRRESNEKLAAAVLEVLNRPNSLDTVMDTLLHLIKNRCGVEAVALRLRQGEDFPYYFQSGFPDHFVMKESFLCARDPQGEIIRDSSGHPVLECMCGHILSGRTDPPQPFFTAGGSFWTNSTTALLASTTEEDRRGRTRNRCYMEGYESVALMPLRAGQEITGLLQLNDHRPGRFTADLIHFLEGISASIGIALNRRRAAEQLLRANALLTAQQEVSIDGILIVDEKGAILSYNRRFAELWSVPEKILAARSDELLLKCAHDQLVDLEEFSKRVRYLYEHKHESSQDELVLKNGRTLDRHSAPMWDAAGHYYGRAWYFRDITASKVAETKLREQLHFQRVLMDAIPAPVFYKDTNLRYTDFNRAFLEFFGPAAQDALGKTVYDLAPRHLAEIYDRQDRALLDHPGIQVYESQMADGRGTIHEVVFHKATFLDAAGQVAGLVGVMLDVTDYKRSEQSRLVGEERFRRVFEMMTSGVAIYQVIDAGADFVFKDLNPAGQRTSKVTREQVVGRRLLEVFPGAEEIGLVQKLRQAWQTSEPQHLPPICYKDGRVTQWVENHLFRLSDDEVAAIYDDLSERRLVEEQLRQSHKMEAIGRLAGGVAHDFRNQLTVIKGYGEMLLRRSQVKAEGVEKLREILKAAERSALLSSQLLTFSRKEMLRPRVVVLGHLVADIIKAIPRLVGEDIRLHLIPSPLDLTVEIDPGQFQSALINLAANARDAMPNGGNLTLEIDLQDVAGGLAERHPDIKPGEYAMLAVTDTGCGMDEETLSKLFEPFFTTKPVGEGTGLGLPMVYGFVKQSGGTIEVESQIGQGTTMRLYFPLVAEPATVPDAPGQAAAPPGGTETILVVEDEEPVRRMLVESLREAGYTVLEAGSLNEALSLAERHSGRIAALLTDVVMHGGSGVDLAERIRKAQPRIPILFLSGYADKDLSRRGVESAGGYVMTKPVSHDVLLRTVRQQLDAAAGS